MWLRRQIFHTVAFLALGSDTVASHDISILSPGLQKPVPLSRSIAGLSIEFCYITDYLGDTMKPNFLSQQLLQNVEDILGAPPIIRIGGHTQDAARYNQSSPDTLSNLFEPGNLEAVEVTFNSDLFHVLNENAVSHQQYIFGLNFGQNQVDYAKAELTAAESLLHASRLFAYELGNEPDFYSATQRPRPWNVDTYAQQQLNWIASLKTEIKHHSHQFQLGAFAQEPIWQGNFSLAELTKMGLPESLGNVKSYSDHTYPFSVCSSDREALVSLPNLMNHTNTVYYFSQWEGEVAAAQAAGVQFFMGETGSISCHGKDGVSNTLGAALWEIDYMLHGATLGFQGVFFHMGTPFYYSMWQPVPYNNTPPTVYPTYASLLFMADLIADITDPSIVELSVIESDSLAVYSIYDGLDVVKVAVLNTAYYNDSSEIRPSRRVDATQLLGRDLKVTRLTGALSTTTDFENVTWASQRYSRGYPEGQRVTEYYSGGQVEIAASEALIIEK